MCVLHTIIKNVICHSFCAPVYTHTPDLSVISSHYYYDTTTTAAAGFTADNDNTHARAHDEQTGRAALLIGRKVGGLKLPMGRGFFFQRLRGTPLVYLDFTSSVLLLLSEVYHTTTSCILYRLSYIILVVVWYIYIYMLLAHTYL